MLPAFRLPFPSVWVAIVSILSAVLLSFWDTSVAFGLIPQKGSRHTTRRYETSNALSPNCSPALRNVLGQRNPHQ